MSKRVTSAGRLLVLLLLAMSFAMSTGCSWRWKFWKKKPKKKPAVERVEKLQPRTGYPVPQEHK